MYSYKCALVPDGFFEPSKAGAMLSETVDVDENDEVFHIAVPFYNAVMIYALPHGEENVPPELYFLLQAAHDIGEHNKIAASYCEGRLFLVVARDSELLLCNSFQAVDFTTAEYFIFLTLKRFQLNPEVSSIHLRTALAPEQEASLRRYFRSVEHI